ncbi:MAG: flavodoxin family protein [Dehalococcoidia bacterium]|jgi:multimeric flavodoxin WrbA|nr:flavodoxin family protein [Dehalococcoidia bacterium]
MKKVTAFIGTQSRKATYFAVQEFERNLKQLGDIDFEYVFLSDYRLEFCRGCKLCFNKGEELCPLKDDRDVLLEKMENSDGIILASPNYVFHVSARMKNLIDRLAFLCHRPRFFGKACTAVVTQGNMGGGAIAKYLCTSAGHIGFHSSKGCWAQTLDPMTERQRRTLEQRVRKAAARFYRELTRPTPPPSFFRLLIFRMTRTSLKYVDHDFRDYQYYKDKGWFESDYYHPTSLGPVKKLAGRLFDVAARQAARRMQA